MRFLAALALVAFLVGALSGPGVAAAPKPVASIQFGSTISVKGMRFKPRERVAVTIVADQTYRKAATANAKGSFTADFGALAFNDCAAYTLKVVGSKGSRFTLQHAALPC